MSKRKTFWDRLIEKELGEPITYMLTCAQEGWGECEQGFRLCLKCDTACDHDIVCSECHPDVRLEA